MLVAQLSDLHLHAGGLHFGVIDTTERVRLALAWLHALRRRPDVVLLTGDLTNDAEPDAYAVLADLLATSAIPAYLLPGNHDERAPLVEAFPGHHYLPDPGGPLHYAIDDHPVRIVALDTSVPGHQHGEIDEATEDWLERTLAARPDTPTVLAMHHPPIETGIWWMDQICLHGAARVERVVRRHPQVKLVVAGHVHRPVQASWGGTVVSVAPSTGLLAGFDVEEEGVPVFVSESPQVGLHLVGTAGAVVHHASFLAPQHVLRYDEGGPGDWNELKVQLRRREPLPKGGMLG